LAALRRYYKLVKQIHVKTCITIATEAVRRAENGPQFIECIKKFAVGEISIISGLEEAQFAASGIAAAFRDPDGIAGDLGGGSLELIDLKGTLVLNQTSMPLGSLNLIALFEGDMGKALAHIDKHLDSIFWLEHRRDRPFFAIGGTWRSIARLHMVETGYPLSIVQHYTMTPRQIEELHTSIAGRTKPESLKKISGDRRTMLPYGLLVLKRIIERMRPSEVIFSASGVREGLIYQSLPKKEQERDPLLAICEEMASRRARSLQYCNELFEWTNALFQSLDLNETAQERRLRQAACLLSDVGWRGHPDYRGEKVLGLIAQSSFVGIDHYERAFLALAVYYNHQTSLTGDFSPALRTLISRRWNRLAKIIAMSARVAIKLSAGLPDIVNKTTLTLYDGKLVLTLPQKLEVLNGEALWRRFKALAQLLDCEPEVSVQPKSLTRAAHISACR
jgi:exopolyphosphatase/guanosine-5'-triphosphate,3'-diphosphate pyrophosphatase